MPGNKERNNGMLKVMPLKMKIVLKKFFKSNFWTMSRMRGVEISAKNVKKLHFFQKCQNFTNCEFQYINYFYMRAGVLKP